MILEVSDGKAQVHARVQARGVKLVQERGMTVTQASRDLGLHVNVLGKWL